MRILTNAFPTNMPDSEKVSQGGPANFAKLFSSYIASKTSDEWHGLLMTVGPGHSARCRRSFAFPQRSYYRLDIRRADIKRITRATKKADSAAILKKPIALISDLIERIKPDVIFLNGFGILSWLLLKAGQASGVPVVIQHAGIWTKELGIHKKLYSAAGLVMMEEMEKDSTRLSACEIFLNEWSLKYYRRNVAKNHKTISKIIPLPFDFASFHRLKAAPGRKRLGLSRNNVNIGVIARWDEIKNHPAVLDLARIAARKRPDWRFHSVVDIPDNNYDKRFKRDYHRHVSVIPALDRNGISEFCRSIDMLLVPSVFDVSPTVVLEATASNTPVAISKNVGFASTFQKYGGKDRVIDFGSPRAAVGRLDKLLKQKTPRLLAAAIKKNHRHDRVFEEYLRVFRSLKKNTAKS